MFTYSTFIGFTYDTGILHTICCCVCLSLNADCATAALIAICLHCTCIQAAVVAVVWCFVVTGVSCRWAQVADACIQFGREWLLHLLRCRVVWAACVMWQAGGAASAASAAPGSLHVVASVMSAVNLLATKCCCRQCTAQQCAASVLRYTTAVFPACFLLLVCLQGRLFALLHVRPCMLCPCFCLVRAWC